MTVPVLTEGKTLTEVLVEIAGLLVKQGDRCMKGNSCLYGNEKGQHCAVGFLLNDEDEKLMNLEFTDVIGLRYYELGPNQGFIDRNCHILSSLQQIHDNEYLKGRERYLGELLSFIPDEDEEKVAKAFFPWILLGI